MVFERFANLISQKCVVLVDDDANIRRVYGDMLRKRNYEVVSASCMEELKRKVVLDEDEEAAAEEDDEKVEDVDVFLLDLFLDPKPNGVDIAKLLRRKGFECPICFITAKPCSVQEERHLTSILDDLHFLQKPISPRILLRTVAHLTGNL